jgi:hypothetical protein
LAVVIRRVREVQAERGVARQRPGRVARQDVDLARLQRREALLRVQRNPLDLVAVPDDRRGDRAADVDVQAGPVALAVGGREPGEPRVLPACAGPAASAPTAISPPNSNLLVFVLMWIRSSFEVRPAQRPTVLPRACLKPQGESMYHPPE